MNSKLALTLKVVVSITTPALAVMASLYVLDIVSGEALREGFRKTMAIMGIFTVAAFVPLLMTGRDKDTPEHPTEHGHED